MRAPLPAAVVMLCTAGCNGGTELDWSARFATADLETRASIVRFELLEEGCAGTVVYTVDVPIGGAASGDEPPALEPGRYGFRARARDDGCVWFAEDCDERELPIDETRIVSELDVVPDAAPDCTGCDAPACTTECEAVARVSAGSAHTCAVTESGRLWCWGDNDRGQLGIESLGERVPARVQESSYVDVAAGTSHGCAVRSDDTLWCWGDNASGQLGTGDRTAQPSPVQVGGAWDAVTVGGAHTCAREAGSGEVRCWGRNDVGQLGDGNDNDSLAPASLADGIGPWVSLGAGLDTTCATSTTSALWCWGRNTDGQLGTGDGNPFRNRPEVVGSGFLSVSMGGMHGCAIGAGGAVQCWGEGTSGELGDGNASSSSTPGAVASAAVFHTVGAGRDHACAIDDAGEIWCWGDDASGQLGLGARGTGTAPTPTMLRRAFAAAWRTLDAGDAHTCAVGEDGSLWCWGENGSGQVGIGTRVDASEPTRVCIPVP